ncbi:hypothetical protein SAMN05444672_1421, partial [Bacillus sp. OK838]
SSSPQVLILLFKIKMTPGKSVYLKGKTKLIGTEGTRLLREKRV